ncbi:MAG: bifunctional demethylmenaquinone methyltransferase/2-methoxy-6-polyprenyl-1,4-benzoquinol methylase UbiE [Candidatus Acidiferrales bacterium]|jgi:demethylmenaquinone methyltransferase/2-methoxy-6-polyprenyl-1,4-benzoquinol methylase
MMSQGTESRPVAARQRDSVPLPGTRPEGARDEAEAGLRVREMFGRIAPRYDFLNHLLSLSLDRLWRRRTAKRFADVLAQPNSRVLDLCCGTGDLTFVLERQADTSKPSGRDAARILGSDFALPMLTRAREKGAGSRRRASFLAADALSLPFASESFDLVTAAFGFRNLANYEHGLSEIMRVLRKGGRIGILEFSDPQSGFGAGAFRFYFRYILPRVGGAISGNAEAYSYLPGSVAKFPSPAELSKWMERAGFADVHYELWNFGSVALHSGRKP